MEKNNKFLIIGASGLIGRTLIEEINGKYDWKGTYFSRKSSSLIHLDIANVTEVKKIFEITTPSYVIHCANLSGGVDLCEKNPKLAKKFHFEGTINIGKQCFKHNSKFIFISSDCVFDGKKSSAYTEEDDVHPMNVYGKYKAESEKWIQANLKNYVIIRTMSVYGWDPQTITPNAIMKVYFSILEGNKVFVPTFRWGTPTYVKDLSKAIVELSISNSRFSGLIHVSGTSFINRYLWLKETCYALGWDSSFVLPLEDAPKNMVFRPYKINLDTSKFRKNFKTKLHNLKDGLKLLKADILKCSLRNKELVNKII